MSESLLRDIKDMLFGITLILAGIIGFEIGDECMYGGGLFALVGTFLYFLGPILIVAGLVTAISAWRTHREKKAPPQFPTDPFEHSESKDKTE